MEWKGREEKGREGKGREEKGIGKRLGAWAAWLSIEAHCDWLVCACIGHLEGLNASKSRCLQMKMYTSGRGLSLSEIVTGRQDQIAQYIVQACLSIVCKRSQRKECTLLVKYSFTQQNFFRSTIQLVIGPF